MKREITNLLPAMFSGSREETFPDDLIGATVLKIGATDARKRLAPLLAIEYIPKASKKPKRLMLSFTELGMWIEKR